MSRFPSLPASSLPEDEKPYGEKIDALATSSFGPSGSIFVHHSSNGGLLGPLPAMIASKQVGLDLFNLAVSISSLPGLPIDAKEIAILVAGARFQAPYETYAHGRVAVKKAGLSEAQVQKLIAGEKPAGLNEKASLAYDVAHYLANVPGPLPQELFDNANTAFGRDGTLALTHYVGVYSYLSILLNMADAPVPEDE